MRTFPMPDLGEGLQEAEIVAWHVAAGDRVVRQQPLVSVETDKAVVEVPAPWSGVVAELCGEPGDTVAVGAPLAVFESDDARPGEDSGAIVGHLPGVGGPDAEGVSVVGSGKTASTARSGDERAAARAKAAPAVRKRARELGLSLDGISGSGPGGAITMGDLDHAAANADGRDWQPLRGVRRAMSRNMTRAASEVAATTVSDDANVSHWPADMNVMLRLIRAVAAGCSAEPALNAWYDSARDARLLHDRVDLGVAVNTDDGLFVPVLRDIANRTAEDLERGLDALKRDVAARTVPPEELRDQTMTVSNFGVAGGRYAALMVVPPQVAILGAGRIVNEPCVRDGEVLAGRVLPLSLTFDHRVVTGVEALHFLNAVIASLEE